MKSVHFHDENTFWIWSCHSLLARKFGRKFADFAFPSDHRVADMTLLNIVRNGIFAAVDWCRQRLDPTTGNMTVLYEKL